MKRFFHFLFLLFIAAAVAAQNGKAKYVFYFIGDGMGLNQVHGTEIYKASLNNSVGVESLLFTTFPVASFATSYSSVHRVTDSAAGGSALATGVKTKNGGLGVDSTMVTPVSSVAVWAKEAGHKVGVATSVSIDHATPAAFYAHQRDRGMMYEIALDIPKAGFDFYAGSGFLRPDKDHKKQDAPSIYPILESAGYRLVKGYNEFQEVKNKADKIILMQEEGGNPKSIPYAIDRKPGDLTLSQITEAAIEVLTKDNENGFFLMVEGGKIDWACHAGDAATVFHEVMDMDDAIRVAYNFYEKHPDETLIVVTADHETGALALSTGSMRLEPAVFKNQKVSQEGLSEALGQLRRDKKGNVSWEDLQELLKDKMGFWDEVPISAQAEQKIREAYDKSFQVETVEMVESLYARDEPVAAVSVGILSQMARLGWSNNTHTAAYIPVFAIGAGCELFTHKMDNTDLPKKIKQAAGY
ncbi:MAG: alkaline phosphatase [Bacteroides sp.]|nr:alkaline phosphatase [Bacteroides sp.]